MISIIRKRAASIVLFIASALFLAKFLRAMKIGGVFDDSYMFARYADNIINHGLFGWNVGEKTFGCTSIPYAFVVVIGKLLNFNDFLSVKRLLITCSYVLGVAAVFLIYRILCRLQNAHGGNSQLDGDLIKLVVSGMMITPMFYHSVVTGMDTTMAILSNALVIYMMIVYDKNRTTAIMVLAAFAAYFTFLVRPDNGVYATLFPFLFLVYKKRSIKDIVKFFAVLGAFFALDVIAKQLYFGNPLPLSFYAKSSGFYKGYIGHLYWNPVRYTLEFFKVFSLPLIFAICFLDKQRIKALGVFILPMLVTFAYYFTVVQIMGYDSRYYLPSIPFMLIGAAYVLRDVPGESGKSPNLKFAYYAFLGFLVMMSFNTVHKDTLRRIDMQALKISGVYKEPRLERAGFVCEVTGKFSAFPNFTRILKEFPSIKKVMITEYGYVASANPDVEILDPIALHNKELALGGWSDDYLTQQMPEIIWIHPDYTWLTSRVEKLAKESGKYIVMPDAIRFGLIVRKDSVVLKPENIDLFMEIAKCKQVADPYWPDGALLPHQN